MFALCPLTVTLSQQPCWYLNTDSARVGACARRGWGIVHASLRPPFALHGLDTHPTPFPGRTQGERAGVQVAGKTDTTVSRDRRRLKPKDCA